MNGGERKHRGEGSRALADTDLPSGGTSLPSATPCQAPAACPPIPSLPPQQSHRCPQIRPRPSFPVSHSITLPKYALEETHT